jgi:hypothetical protein
MPNFEIYFYGLICHVGDDEGFGLKNAALVTSTTHRPRAVVSAANHLTEIDLVKGDVLSLSVGQGDAVANTAFESFVPSLREKTDKPSHLQALKNGVRTSKNFDVATAYFLHARSSLVVADLYKDKAAYSMLHKSTSEQCVAHLTLAVVKTDAEKISLIIDNEMTSGRGSSWEATDWILITNLFHSSSSIHIPQDHFMNHLQLTDAAEIAHVHKIKNGCSDEQQAFSEPKAVHLSEVNKYIDANSTPPDLETSKRSSLTFFDLGQPDCSDTRWP